MIRDYKIAISDEVISTILEKVAAYPWEAISKLPGWEHGTNAQYLKEICDYWVSEYDWRQAENQLNGFSNFVAPVDGLDIHFIHENGSGSNPLPLLISHGWPGSVIEFQAIIEPLAHPERFGGNAEDGFDVIVPSLPGFGFSGKPERPMGPRAMANILNRLMTENLGYATYLAQGGDWGGAISSWLGFDHGTSCKGIHINILTMRHPDGPLSEAEKVWDERFSEDQIMQDGYRTQQATKPQTLSYAMMDSPVGVASWILEKFEAWSDTTEMTLEEKYTKDHLLTNIMIYLVTETFGTASWIYFGRREEGGRLLSSKDVRVEVPTGCAIFPEEMLEWPPRSYVERLYNVVHWTEMPRGGHFGAMEEPQLMLEDIRKFARLFR